MSSSNAYGTRAETPRSASETLTEAEDYLRAAELALIRVAAAVATASAETTPELMQWRDLIRQVIDVRVELQRAAANVG